MNIRSFSSMVLTGFTLVSASFLPALAADSGKPELQRGGVNSVQVGQAGEGRGRFVARGNSCEGGSGSGEHGARGMHRHHHGMFGSLTGPLAVSNDQLEKIFALKSQAADQITPKVIDLISSSRQMHEAMTEPNVDKSRVLGLQAKINGDKDAIANVKVETKLDELAVLTPDQRQQLRQNFVKWSAERGGRRG